MSTYINGRKSAHQCLDYDCRCIVCVIPSLCIHLCACRCVFLCVYALEKVRIFVSVHLFVDGLFNVWQTFWCKEVQNNWITMKLNVRIPSFVIDVGGACAAVQTKQH